MRVYFAANGNPEIHEVINSDPDFGMMIVPGDMRPNFKGRKALDNGAYSSYSKKEPFNEKAFLNALEKVENPDFVIIPDIVRGGLKSLQFSIDKRKNLPDCFKYYLAVQDDMVPSSIPGQFIEKIDGVFVGGSKDWKQKTGGMWVEFAHEIGLPCHIGRIGTLKKIMWASNVGADSIDSSNLTKHPKNRRHLLEWKAGQHRPLEAFPLAS